MDSLGIDLFFKVSRGCRQGCPLSCQIFLCYVEALGIRIRQEREIQGVKLAGKEKKLGQYADDLWVAMIHNKACYSRLFQVLKPFLQILWIKS